MLIKIIVFISFFIGLKMLYTFNNPTSIPETPIDTAWWNNLSEEWKSILLINQNFQQQNVDIFKLQDEYINRLNKAGEPAYSPMNRSLHDYNDDKVFILSYKDFYERAIRKNHLVRNDSIELSTLANLETIYMVNGPADLSPLKKFPQLKVLIMNFCRTDIPYAKNKEPLDLEPLKNLKELKVFHCVSSSVASLDAIKNLINLEEISCNNTDITSLEPLNKLGHLKKLSVGSKLTNASAISKLETLEDLSIDGCKQIPNLSKLKNLKALYIAEAELSIVNAAYRINNIDFLKDLTTLEYLDLDYTSYKGGLNVLDNLEHLKAITLPPVSSMEIPAFKAMHTNCIIINSYKFER